MDGLDCSPLDPQAHEVAAAEPARALCACARVRVFVCVFVCVRACVCAHARAYVWHASECARACGQVRVCQCGEVREDTRLSTHTRATHTHKHTRAHAHTHARTHARTRTHTHAHTHTHTHAQTHAHTHMHTRTRTHTHSHTCARAHTRDARGTQAVSRRRQAEAVNDTHSAAAPMGDLGSWRMGLSSSTSSSSSSSSSSTPCAACVKNLRTTALPSFWCPATLSLSKYSM